MTSASRPDSISGGCLCGAIRYTIQFPAGAEWPPSHNATCQCTQCRKTTGSLLPHLLELPATDITPDLTTESPSALPTYRLYRSSPKAQRGFCATCGSSLTWQTADAPGRIEVHVGTLDEEVLIGKVVEEKDGDDGYGAVRKRNGGWGKELAVARWHNYVENAVPGVTDGVAGPKYLTVGSQGQRGFEGDLASIGRA
ncbi:uncharacterized protein LTHEOB_4748 [Lasiodiplodia theobromae]|uniref:uncharacterized protein n=1 Tax=Lasiodiplodia theobromae TaxID=45133 RepID=UPI0015C2C884|nr:uncharacterized protein LTHEOB_4748 [Lasiodiplodia theobromae]KAF4546096.1 hypothetical protein LTHEOB_4748 [Lasiodiplodia theobromae]